MKSNISVNMQVTNTLANDPQSIWISHFLTSSMTDSSPALKSNNSLAVLIKTVPWNRIHTHHLQVIQTYIMHMSVLPPWLLTSPFWQTRLSLTNQCIGRNRGICRRLLVNFWTILPLTLMMSAWPIQINHKQCTTNICLQAVNANIEISVPEIGQVLL